MSSLDYSENETQKYILLLKWISFVDNVDFVEVVVVAVDPESHGVEGNGAVFNIWLQWNGKGIASNKDGSNHNG